MVVLPVTLAPQSMVEQFNSSTIGFTEPSFYWDDSSLSSSTLDTTNDTCNGTYECLGFEDEEVDPFAMPLWRKLIWSFFFFVMVATADIGNIIVIWIVMSNARMRSVTNYFIINLSMADIMNATLNVIPNFTYMLTGNWPFGEFFCKLGGYISILSVCVSVFTLVAISVDRYNAIINPLRPRLSKFKTTLIAFMTWLLGLSIGIPMLLFFSTVTDPADELNRTQCISKWPDAVGFDSKLEYGYNVTFMIMTYFLPMMSMCYTYSRIGLELWGSRAIGEATEVQAESIKSKRKVVKMMMMVVLIFIVCWLPYHTYFITANINPEINYSHYIQEIYLMIYWLAMSNSMYNPMIYCYMNQRFRKGFGKVLNFILWWRNHDPLSNNKFKRVEASKGKDSKNHLKVPNGHRNGGLAQNGSTQNYFSAAIQSKVESPNISQKSFENLGQYSSNSPSDQMSNTSAFPQNPKPSSPTAFKKRTSNFINMNTFLKKARGNYVKVDTLQVKVCDSSSDSGLLETSLICSVNPSSQVETKYHAFGTPNPGPQCNYVEQVNDNLSIILTIDKSSEADSSSSSGRKSADQLTQSEMLLKPNLVNMSPTMSLSLPEMVGRREKLV